MKKALVLLVIGVAVGYWWGYRDARTYDTDVVTRMIHQAGGKTRESVKSNTDRLMDSVEGH
ncbi:MAG TPA: hypothetical protein VF488_13930 [Gemmatimonadaceae bacterium]